MSAATGGALKVRGVHSSSIRLLNLSDASRDIFGAEVEVSDLVQPNHVSDEYPEATARCAITGAFLSDRGSRR